MVYNVLLEIIYGTYARGVPGIMYHTLDSRKYYCIMQMYENLQSHEVVHLFFSIRLLSRSHYKTPELHALFSCFHACSTCAGNVIVVRILALPQFFLLFFSASLSFGVDFVRRHSLHVPAFLACLGLVGGGVVGGWGWGGGCSHLLLALVI